MKPIVALPLIAITALLLAQQPFIMQLGLSALPLAIIMGVVYGHYAPPQAQAKSLRTVRFCQQHLLRFGIILFGFQLNFSQLVQLGWQTLLLDALVIFSVLSCGIWLGIKVFKLDRDLVILTSAGSAICGAAAILATESVLKPKQQQASSMAIATVVLFGTLAMFSYPLLYQITAMSEWQFGIYIGSTVHEVAQAVAAGASISDATLQTALVVKLLRVLLLAPFIMALALYLNRGTATPQPALRLPLPWFVLGFALCAAINSYIEVPDALRQILNGLSQATLAIAMAALGAQTQWRSLKQAGLRPVLLALCLFVLLLVGGFCLNRILIA